jgi:predicted NBD/HSP70 family sugar kinase
MRKVPDQWLSSILLSMYQRPAVTREEIIRSTLLNGGSASQALRYLIDSGTILKIGELKSKAGRRRDVLKLNPEAGYFIAVDLETARIRYALTSLVGDIRFRWEQELDFGQGPDISNLLFGIEMVRRNLEPWQQSRVLAVGIACPGMLEDDRLVTAVNLGWHRFPLLDKLSEVISIPVFLGASCRAYVLAEQGVGSARNTANCVYVELGKGIGAGIVIDRRYLEGNHHMAGEFGHITIDPSSDSQCNCGKRGCLEALASISSIVRRHAKLSGKSPSDRNGAHVSEVFEKARRNDPVALKVLDTVVKAIGLGISHLVLLFNPALVILGGELLLGEDLLLPGIKRELANHLPAFFGPPPEVIVTSLGMDIGLKGCALLAFQNSLASTDSLKKLTTPLTEAIVM